MNMLIVNLKRNKLKRKIEMNKKVKKVLVSALTAAVIGLALYGGSYLLFNKGTLTHQLEVQAEKSKSQGLTSDMRTEMNRYIIMTNLHQMSNTHIIAEDGYIWGRQNLSNDEIDRCIDFISTDERIRSKTNVNDLIAYLNEWKEGDYSHAVELHNTIWEYLGGTVGRAVKVRE